MNKRILAVMKKEFLEMKRTKILRILIIAPIIQVILFGYVATTDVKNVKTAICDENNTYLSRSFSYRFLTIDYFDVRYYIHSSQKLDFLFKKNKVFLGIRIPTYFSEDIKKFKKIKVQLIVDGTDSNMSLISLNRAILITNEFYENLLNKKMKMMKYKIGNVPDIKIEERFWYNPELKSANTMVPGVIALILMLVSLLASSVSIVREKETGNIEQLIVTPIKPYEFIFGKIIPYIFIAILDIILVVGLALIIFDITFEGNFLLLLFLSIFMILTNLGVGIFISTISKTQQQAMITTLIYFPPNLLLSGFIFPIKNMPEILQIITYLIPMRYFMVIVRGIFLKGSGFIDLLPQTVALTIYGLIVFILSMKKFKKTLV